MSLQEDYDSLFDSLDDDQLASLNRIWNAYVEMREDYEALKRVREAVHNMVSLAMGIDECREIAQELAQQPRSNIEADTGDYHEVPMIDCYDTEEDDDVEEGDDMCDFCMRSGIAIYTTADGMTICSDCEDGGYGT